MAILATTSYAQQGRGLFLSTFGVDAPNTYGDFDNIQAFYFDIPKSETKPIYLRLFDADIGGAYDEKHGEFDTETQFIVLGGASANKTYGAGFQNEYNRIEFAKEDELLKRIFTNRGPGDSRWYSLLQLPLEKGFDLGNGFVRFALISKGLKGDDGNFFDLALSYSETEKVPPTSTKTFVYDLSLRIPSLLLYDWTEFTGQIKIPVTGSDTYYINTFDMDDVPMNAFIPLQGLQELTPSGDGNWVESKIEMQKNTGVEWFGFTFYGRPFNNTFSLLVLDDDRKPVPILLPITDYEPPVYPQFAYHTKYKPEDCYTINFSTEIANKDLVQSLQTKWIFEQDTLSGESISKRFDSLGYHHFSLEISARIAGAMQLLQFQDSVLINTPPVAWAGGDRASVANFTMAFDGTVSYDPDGKIKRYVWDFGDGTNGSGARVDKKYNETGVYNVKLTVYDDSGTECGVAVSEAKVKINRPPVPKIIAPNWVQLGEEFTLDGRESKDPDGIITDYLWQIGNDTLIEGPVIQYALREEKNTDITLQITDDSRTFNSSQRTNFTIRVNKKPWASAGDDKIISPNRPATFSGRFSRDPDGEIIDYQWRFPDGSIQNGESVQQSFTEPGVYKVYLKVTDNTQKAFGYDSLTVTVNAPPVAVIKGEKIFNTGRVILDASESFDPDGEINDQFWVIDGKSINGSKLNYAFDKPGTYTIQYTVIDNSGTYSAVQSQDLTVVVNDLPQPVFELPSQKAPGEKIQFSAAKSKDSDGEIIAYLWDFGDGNKAEGIELEHKFDFPGTYQVSLTVQDNLGKEASSVILTKEIKINAAPYIDYTIPERVSPGQTIPIDLSRSFDVDGKIISYELLKDSVWVKSSNPKLEATISYTQSEIRLAVVDNSGQSNDRSEVSIPLAFNLSPVAIGNGTIRSASPIIQFDATKSYDPDGDELAYYWDFGDGKSMKGPLVMHKYKFGGSFKAVLTVDDQRGLNNSLAVDTVFVFINRPPEPYFELPSIVCVGDTLYYDGTNSYEPDGGLLRYEWIFGDGKSSLGGKGKHVYEQEGRYQIVLTLDDNEGMPNSIVSYSVPIEVVGAPEAYAGEDFTACEGELVQFDGSASSVPSESYQEYSWDFGDGNQEIGVAPSHIFNKAGRYKVTLTVKGDIQGSCKSSDTDVVYVTVIPKPQAKFELPSIVRLEDPIVFDPTPSIVEGQQISQITWQIGEDETVSFRRIQNENGSEWQMSSTKPLEGRTTYPDRSGLGQLPTFERVLPAGDYQISLMIETQSVANCNTAQQVKYVTIKDRPQLAVEDIPVLVPGVPFQFSAADVSTGLNEVKTAYWNFGDGTTKQGVFVSHTYNKPGNYSIEFIADDGSGGASAITRIEKKVKVNAQPKAVFTGADRALPGDVITFDASESSDEDGTITQYYWFFSDGGRAEGAVVAHEFKRNGNFTVTLSVSDDANAPNSLHSVSKSIRVANAPDLSLSVPNIICPGTELNLVRALSVPTNDTSRVQFFIGNKRVSYKEAENLSFTFPGVYNIRVVLSSLGTDGTNVLRHTLVVNGSPEVYATVPELITIGAANEFATFDASNSFDPNGDLVRITWDFGDGNTAYGKKVQHLYKRPGTYTVKLSIMDDKQLPCSTSEKTFTVKVVKE